MKFKPVDNTNRGRGRRSLDGFIQTAAKKSAELRLTPEVDKHLDDIYEEEPTPKAAPKSHDIPTPKKTGVPTRIGAKTGKQDIITIFDEPHKKHPIADRRHRREDKKNKFDTSKHPKSKKAVKRVVLSVLALVFITAGWFGWKLYRNAAAITKNNNPFSLFGVFKKVPLKNTDGRVNVLVAGNSVDDPGHGGATLTDSIMVLSIDTRKHNAFIVSIPRDLWVNIPGLGYQKINAANTVEEFSKQGYPNGGMGALEYVVSKNLGIPIHYYGLINYGAFKDTVNALGGITVTIKSSDKRGLYDPNISPVDGGPLKLANGEQKLNGQTALNLARARGDHYLSYGFPQSDFDRTKHQRMMLLAVKDKASSVGIIANPLKAGKLIDALGKNVQTDLKLEEIQSLIAATKDLSNNNITSLNINNLNGDDELMLANYRSESGQSALIPAAGVDDFSDIQAALKKIMSNDPVVKEAANVVVLNGSDTEGLSKQYGETLTTKGMVVSITANAPTKFPTTTLIDNSKGKKPGTLASLKATFGNNVSTNASLTATYPRADFIVVLGANATTPQ